jgi:CDP-6-deoxy-D-xylo-4-hexulose-3-dehydrase
LYRGAIRQSLNAYGVESRPLFGCIPLHQPAYRKYKERYMGKLPNAEHLGVNAFYIGCHQYLRDGDIGFIRAALEVSISRLAVRR